MAFCFSNYCDAMVRLIIRAVSKKGQITIPKRLREKYGIKDKVVLEELEQGILLKTFPTLSEELGSLKNVFGGKNAGQLLRRST